jgi:PST family polysaccharide transporter
VGTGVAINKAVALWVGPAGLAMVGQLGSFVATAGVLAGGGINLGITKYMAEHPSGVAYRTRLLSTALRITLACTILVAGAVVLLREHLSRSLLGSPHYSGIFTIFAATLTLLSLNALLLSAMNGAGEIRRLVAVNVLSSFAMLAVSVFLIGTLQLHGALIAVVVAQSLTLVISLAFARRSVWFQIRYFLAPYNPVIARRLAGYALMAVTTAVTLPLSHILIRNHLSRTISWEAAGYWQGVWQISEGYLLIVTTTLTLYYLPKLSAIRDKEQIQQEVLAAYRTLVPVAIVSAFLIYLLRDFITVMLFSSSFLPMRDLFAAQLVGDVLKIASWMLSYLMVAKAMIGLFVVTEIVFACTFVGFTVLLTDQYGLVGVSFAFAINYGIYFLTMIAFVGRRLFSDG